MNKIDYEYPYKPRVKYEGKRVHAECKAMAGAIAVAFVTAVVLIAII